MITPRVKFEKQFGDGVDPWYAKAERWAKKQRFPISFLALGLIEWLKQIKKIVALYQSVYLQLGRNL